MNSCPYCGEVFDEEMPSVCPRCDVVLQESAEVAGAGEADVASIAVGDGLSAEDLETPISGCLGSSVLCPHCDKPVKKGRHRCGACGRNVEQLVPAEVAAEHAQFRYTVWLGVAGCIGFVVFMGLIIALCGS